MRYRSIGLIFATIAAFAFRPVLFAQNPGQSGAVKSQTAAATQSQSAPATPDLTGVWDILGERTPNRGRFGDGVPPLQPWAMEKYQALRKGMTDINERAPEELDPSHKCAPPSPSRIMTNPHLFEILQIPGRVILRFEWDNWSRDIWTDGRGHPKDLYPTWMGHSTGKWEGDTLVVDTIGVNGLNWLDSSGIPYTDALHMVEHIHRVKHDTLAVDFWFEDPKAYTKPWNGGQKKYTLRPDWNVAEYLNCEDEVLERLHVLPSWYFNDYKP